LVGSAADFAKWTERGVLRRTVERIKQGIELTDQPGKFLYGTDWPLAPMNVYRDFVRHMFPDEFHPAVFQDNAKGLFKLRGQRKTLPRTGWATGGKPCPSTRGNRRRKWSTGASGPSRAYLPLRGVQRLERPARCRSRHAHGGHDNGRARPFTAPPLHRPGA